MDFFEYIMDGGGMLLLGLFVVIVLLYNKIKARRAFRIPSEKRRKRK